MINLVALDFGFILSGSLLVEIVFSINGMGSLIHEAGMNRDYPMLQGCFLLLSLVVLFVNFLVDMGSRILDPPGGGMKRPASGTWLAANRWPVAGSVIVLGFGLMAVSGPFFLPHGAVDGAKPFLPPSLEHFFGTNDVGADIFSEWVLAARISLTIGLLSSLISVVVGGSVGILAGYARGLWGEALTSVIDVLLLIPVLPLLVVTVAYVGP